MNLIKKYTLEIFLFSLFFYSFIASGWAGRTLHQKILALITIILFFVFLGMLRLAKVNYPGLVVSLANFISSSKFQSLSILFKYLFSAFLAVVFIIITSLLEMLFLTAVVGYDKILALGFPFPVYSFVSSRLLPVGVFLNMVVIAATILLYSKVKNKY